MKLTFTLAGLPALVAPALLAACQLLGNDQQLAASPATAPGAMTCAEWLDHSDNERLVVADRLVGDSAALLERIRVRQHQPEGTPRAVLVRDVVGSLTKNCEVWPPRDRTVGEVMSALYQSAGASERGRILRPMHVLDAGQFEAMRRSTLGTFGRMSSRNAKGFIIDLDVALERAGLDGTTAKWRGGDDGLFTATGQFDGEPVAWTALMLAALEDVAYEGNSAATVDVSSGAVHITFATWAPTIGLATVRIDAQPDPGDIRAR